MPPEDADERPSRQERETVIGWIRAFCGTKRPDGPVIRDRCSPVV